MFHPGDSGTAGEQLECDLPNQAGDKTAPTGFESLESHVELSPSSHPRGGQGKGRVQAGCISAHSAAELIRSRDSQVHWAHREQRSPSRDALLSRGIVGDLGKVQLSRPEAGEWQRWVFLF